MAGRPKKDIDIEQLMKLCEIQCTKDEIAYILDCSPDTIEGRVKQLYNVNFSAFYKTHSAMGKMSLRRNMFKLAETSASMAIWLSKQHLGMREPQADMSVPEEEQENNMSEYDK